MKGITRKLVFYSTALFLVSQIIPGFMLKGEVWGILIAALVLTVAFHLIEPVIRLVFLPINLITLGFFSTIIHAVVFWAALQFLKEYFTIEPWRFSGWEFSPLGITVAPLNIGVIATIFIVAFLVSAFVTVAEKLV